MGEVYPARDTTRFIVTEFVEGESLRQMMPRERPILREALSRAAIAAAPQAGEAPAELQRMVEKTLEAE